MATALVSSRSSAFKAFATHGSLETGALPPLTETATLALVRYFEDGGMEILNAT